MILTSTAYAISIKYSGAEITEYHQHQCVVDERSFSKLLFAFGCASQFGSCCCSAMFCEIICNSMCVLLNANSTFGYNLSASLGCKLYIYTIIVSEIMVVVEDY